MITYAYYELQNTKFFASHGRLINAYDYYHEFVFCYDLEDTKLTSIPYFFVNKNYLKLLKKNGWILFSRKPMEILQFW